MEQVKKFFNQKSVIVALLAFLVLSTALNVYQYLRHSDSTEREYEYTVGAWITGDVLGMGGINVFLSKGLVVVPEEKFNITVYLNVWAPYTASETWNISFKLHKRPLYGEYPDTPISEKTITMHKSRNAMTASGSSGPFTLTAPPTWGIWIYRVCTGVPKLSGSSIEFPITVSPPAYRPIPTPIPQDIKP